MRRTWTYLAAATLAVASAALVHPTMAQTGNPGTGEQLGRQVDEATGANKDKATEAKTNRKVDESVATDVRKTLARAVNDAYTKDSLDDFVGYFSKADRDRIGKVPNQQNDDLNQKIAEFRKAFKDKYNQDFDIKEEHLSNLAIYQGQDKDHCLVQMAGMPAKGASKMEGEGAAIGRAMGESKGTGNLMTLNLVNEGTILNAWRINIPDQMSLQDLKAALSKNLTTLTSQKDSWPADVRSGYHAAARHVFMSLTTSPMAIEK